MKARFIVLKQSRLSTKAPNHGLRGSERRNRWGQRCDFFNILLKCRLMNDRFLKACRREPVDCTPVWFMRQAGRYMAEYRSLRAKHSMLDLCKTPELAAQVTLQPIDRFPLDAAIIFADILLPLEAMGLNLEFAEREGPVIHNPVRERADVDRDMWDGVLFFARAPWLAIPLATGLRRTTGDCLLAPPETPPTPSPN